MARDIKDVGKLTGRFSIDKSVKTPIVEIYCENCLRQERAVAYEDDLPKTRFSRPHFECDNCGSILCELCTSGNIVCPECETGLLAEVTPKSGYDFCEQLRNL